MFNFAFSEMALIIVLATAILGPKDSLRCIAMVKDFFAHIGRVYSKYIEYVAKELDDIANDTNYDTNYNKRRMVTKRITHKNTKDTKDQNI